MKRVIIIRVRFEKEISKYDCFHFLHTYVDMYIPGKVFFSILLRCYQTKVDLYVI